MKLTKNDQELIHLALQAAKKRFGDFSTVGAALRTKKGKIYTGVNIEQIHSSACSMCAEYSAIAPMQTEADQLIETIVAIDFNGRVLPPCGRCRELLRQFGNPYVILQIKGKTVKKPLDELIPFWETNG